LAKRGLKKSQIFGVLVGVRGDFIKKKTSSSNPPLPPFSKGGQREDFPKGGREGFPKGG